MYLFIFVIYFYMYRSLIYLYTIYKTNGSALSACEDTTRSGVF